MMLLAEPHRLFPPLQEGRQGCEGQADVDAGKRATDVVPEVATNDLTGVCAGGRDEDLSEIEKTALGLPRCFAVVHPLSGSMERSLQESAQGAKHRPTWNSSTIARQDMPAAKGLSKRV